MPPGKARNYRSYLLRCWIVSDTKSSEAPASRFVVEHVSGRPRRRGFDTVEELISFLRIELLGLAEESRQVDNLPNE